MNRVICQLAFRESGFFTVPVIVILLGYCLFQPTPLRHYDSVVLILSIALGFGLGKFVFSDKPGVRSFLFSRAYSPKRFFLVRWGFGLAMIFITAILIAAIILLGLRQSIQMGLFRNAWFPIIRFYELHVLWTFVLASLLSFHTTMFWVVRNRFLIKPKRTGLLLWLRRLSTFLIVLILLFVGGWAVFAIGFDMLFRVNYVTYSMLPYLVGIFLPTALVQMILTPWYGVYCYRNQEIES